ncbi:MAG: hypothetical protein ACT4PZ_01580 [Panacagrimonas sp.]
MMRSVQLALAVLLSAGVSACATPGGWMGAEAEKGYEKELAAKRIAEAYNNDDYYEIYKDGRIYAFSDFKDYQSWLKTDEVPLVVTKIGAGPKGETIKLQLNKAEAKSMEKTVGYKGAAQKMFEGELVGIETGFYAEIIRPERVWVFENGKDLHEFQKSGEVPCGITQIGAGPEGKTVVYAQNCKAAAKAKPEAAIARFKKNYSLK